MTPKTFFSKLVKVLDSSISLSVVRQEFRNLNQKSRNGKRSLCNPFFEEKKKIPKESFVDKQPRIAPAIYPSVIYLDYGVGGSEIS